MGKRHETIGIKQAIRFEWMQKAVNLLRRQYKAEKAKSP